MSQSDSESGAAKSAHSAPVNFAVFVVAMLAWIAWLWWTMPPAGAFNVIESSRNALNGAFVLDLIAEMPVSDPAGWAKDYYFQYPALTILFYPPLLFFWLAGGYAVGGVGHETAQLVILFFFVLLGLGLYSVGRQGLSDFAAGIFSLLVLTGLEFADLAREILLEVPMLAFTVWSVWAVLRYRSDGRARYIYLALFLALCAVYTKQTSFYVFIALGLFLLLSSRGAVLQRKEVWISAAVGLLCLVPLAVLQWKFGSFNLVSVAGRDDVGIPRFSWESITYYARLAPEALSWPAAVAVAIGMGVALTGRFRRNVSGVVLLMWLWLMVGYVTLTLISLKTTPRIGAPLFIPMAFFAAVAVEALTKAQWRWLAGVALLVVGVGISGAYSVPQHVTGYRATAEKVIELAEKNARVVFSGHRDGDFVFNVRELDAEKNICVLRSDKLFLNIAIMPELGVDARDYDEEAIAELLNGLGVTYVVSTPEFWAHIPVMARFWNVLNGDGFEQVAEIDGLRSSRSGTKPERLIIFRNLGELSDPPRDYRIELKAIDTEISRD